MTRSCLARDNSAMSSRRATVSWDSSASNIRTAYIAAMSCAQRPIMSAFTLAALLILMTAEARGQGAPAQNDDHRAVIEIGLAGERGVTGSSSSAGGSVAAELTPVENWLEMESGITALRGAGHNEIAVDLLFKKPWQLSATAEFMAGLGPELRSRLRSSRIGCSGRRRMSAGISSRATVSRRFPAASGT